MLFLFFFNLLTTFCASLNTACCRQSCRVHNKSACIHNLLLGVRVVSVKLNISLAHGNFAVACSEIEQAVGKLMFDGSNEHVNCVAQHEDYGHLIHKAGLLLVGPLLKDKNGRGYRCPRQGQPECKHIILLELRISQMFPRPVVQRDYPDGEMDILLSVAIM